MNLIIKAREFAREAHKDQKRKWTNEPYFTHPQRVALAVLQLPDSTEEMVAAAYLHDVVEDCDIDYKTLLEEFGYKTAEYVIGLTSASKLTKSKSNRKTRKQMDLDFMTEQCKEVHLIKLEDRWDNVCDMATCPDSGFMKLYHEETDELMKIIGYANPDMVVAIRNVFEHILHELKCRDLMDALASKVEPLTYGQHTNAID